MHFADTAVLLHFEVCEPIWLQIKVLEQSEEESKTSVKPAHPQLFPRMCELMVRTVAPVRGPNA